MSTQIDSVNLFKRFTHVQENVPVNLLLFGAPAGGKMSFSHGYVHAPVNDEQSILIALNPEIADYAADGLPSDCYDADTYYRDLLADTLVGFETHYISSLDTNPIISLNKVKDTPVHTVNLAEAYPELHDTLMKDHSAGLDCYVVQCTGNVTTPVRVGELHGVPGADTDIITQSPDSIIGWVGWDSPEEGQTLHVTSGFGDPLRVSSKFFRVRSWTSVFVARKDMKNAFEAGVKPADLQDVLAHALDAVRDGNIGLAAEPNVQPARAADGWFWVPIFVTPDSWGIDQAFWVGKFDKLTESI